MKRLILYIITGIVLFAAVGCSNHGENETSISDDPYEQFVQTFKDFKQTFLHDDFQLISPSELTVLTSSLPENRLDMRKTDTIGDNVEFPTRFELYYLEEKSNVLVKLHFIYSPENSTTGFIAVHGIDELSNTNIEERYKSIPRPQYYEMITSFGGYLVVLNYFDLNDSEEMVDRQAFTEIIVSFYNEVEQTLLPVE